DLGARKVLLEAQDVVHLRAAPAVDRLVVVADAAQIHIRRRTAPVGAGLRGRGRNVARPATAGSDFGRLRRAFGALGEQAQPHILRGVGVLILVDEDVAETLV